MIFKVKRGQKFNIRQMQTDNEVRPSWDTSLGPLSNGDHFIMILKFSLHQNTSFNMQK